MNTAARSNIRVVRPTTPVVVSIEDEHLFDCDDLLAHNLSNVQCNATAKKSRRTKPPSQRREKTSSHDKYFLSAESRARKEKLNAKKKARQQKILQSSKEPKPSTAPSIFDFLPTSLFLHEYMGNTDQQFDSNSSCGSISDSSGVSDSSGYSDSTGFTSSSDDSSLSVWSDNSDIDDLVTQEGKIQIDPHVYRALRRLQKKKSRKEEKRKAKKQSKKNETASKRRVTFGDDAKVHFVPSLHELDVSLIWYSVSELRMIKEVTKTTRQLVEHGQLRIDENHQEPGAKDCGADSTEDVDTLRGLMRRSKFSSSEPRSTALRCVLEEQARLQQKKGRVSARRLARLYRAMTKTSRQTARILGRADAKEAQLLCYEE